MVSDIKRNTVSGVFWSSVERFSVQIIQVIIQIILARILSPADFGIIGMLTIFIAIGQTFIDSGFSNALIRKRDRTQIDNSTMFVFNIIVGIICYLLMFVGAPYIAEFYNTPELTPLTRVVSLVFLFNSMSIVQRALLTIKVDFKSQAKATLTAVILSGVIGVYLANRGFGPWALAIQTASNSLFNMILLWMIAKWRPSLVFSWKSFHEMFSFGSKLLASGILDTIYKNVYTLVIGKAYAATALGYYTKANTLAQLPTFNISRILNRVTFPLMCQISNDEKEFRKVFVIYLRMSAFIVFPICIGLLVIAKPLILILLTEKWLPCVCLLQILCLSLVLHPVQLINLNILQVLGKSNVFLYLEIWKKILGIIILVVTMPLGVEMMCWGLVVSSMLGTVLDMHYSGRYIDVGFFSQVKLLVPTMISSLFMCAALLLSDLFSSSWLSLFCSGIVCVLIYYCTSYFLQRDLIDLTMSILRKR